MYYVLVTELVTCTCVTPLTRRRWLRVLSELVCPAGPKLVGVDKQNRTLLDLEFFTLFSQLTTSSENLSSLFFKLVYLAEIEPERNEIPPLIFFIFLTETLDNMRDLC